MTKSNTYTYIYMHLSRFSNLQSTQSKASKRAFSQTFYEVSQKLLIWTSLYTSSCKMTYDPWGKWQVCVSPLVQVTHCFQLLNQLHIPPVQEYVFKRKTLLFQECLS